jgi:CTP synthase
MQLAAIEFARNVCGITDATSREFSQGKGGSRNFVVDVLEDQKKIVDMGGTMRLGSYPCHLTKGSRVADIYGVAVVSERHRHRYEFNNKYRALFEKRGMTMAGICRDRDLIEIMEIAEHPWFVGVQFHPEFQSKPMAPHPLFTSFVKACLDHRKTAHSRKSESAKASLRKTKTRGLRGPHVQS